MINGFDVLGVCEIVKATGAGKTGVKHIIMQSLNINKFMQFEEVYAQ